jgi:hypothetical protein
VRSAGARHESIPDAWLVVPDYWTCGVKLHFSDYGCQLNRSMQHFVEVYWRGFEILRFFLDAGLIAAPLCPDPLA